MAVSIPPELDIAVLCGGPGAERAVSLQSGRNVQAGLEQAGVSARLVDVSGESSQIEHLVCDLAVNMVHGEFGEDGKLEEILHRRKISCTGSGAACSRLTIDKAATKHCLREAGLPTPTWVVVESVDEASRHNLSFPVVVKPDSGGSSVGISIADDRESLAGAVLSALKYGPVIMIEEFVSGRELTVSMLAEEVLPIIELQVATGFYDYKAKYESEETIYICPAVFSDEMTLSLQKLSSEVFAVLGVRDMARVDLILGPGGPMVLEVNTVPGFTSHSLLPQAAAVAGYSFQDVCVKLVELAWKRSFSLREA